MSSATGAPPAGRVHDPATLRRLVILVGAAVGIDTAFYAVIAPLLPALSHHLHMSKAGAGVLTACYPAGMLIASLPGGMLSVRVGPRLTICTGLTLLAVSTVGFGLLDSAVGLDVARLLEGAGGACSWAGGLAWLMAAAPPDRRGVTMGQAVAAAVGGSMAGPAIGAIATLTSRAALFGALAVLGLALAAITFTIPDDRPTGEAQPVRATAPLLRRGPGLASLWLMLVPAVGSGMLTVLGSLQLHQFGASGAAIGATFLVATGGETFASPLAGTLSDSFGRLAPLQAGLAVITVTFACFTLPTSLLPLAALMVITSAGLGTFWAPSMALLSDAAEHHGVEQALAMALTNLAWSIGQIAGSGAGGALAKLSGNLLPTALGAGVFGVTLALSFVLGRPGRGARGPAGPRNIPA